MKNEIILIDARELKPTQICLGFKEIEHNLNIFKNSSNEEYIKILNHKIVPIVKGPKNKFYLIDRHHHSRSVIEFGKNMVMARIIEDWSTFDYNDFFKEMEKKKYLNLFDENGKTTQITDLPFDLMNMKHDWFRSLSWAIRENKGYSKKVNEIPFYEFRWAEIYREYVSEKMVKEYFELSVKICLDITKSENGRKQIIEKIGTF